MSDNPLTPQQIAELKAAREELRRQDKRLADMKAALIPIPDNFVEDHELAKKRLDALILVYGNKK